MKKQKKLLWAGYVLAVLALAFSYGIIRAASSFYNPINGDFQSYNVFRRMLAGQMPYRDFTNYIGLAPILLNLPFMLLRQTFGFSLFVTNFTCCILFCITVLVVAWLITQRLALSMAISCLLPKLVSSGIVSLLVGPRFSYYFTNLFTNLYTPSNSMRIARIFWPFALVLGYLVVQKLRARRGSQPLDLAACCQSRRFSALLGALAGAGIVWSNDFGLAAAFSLTLLYLMLLRTHGRGRRLVNILLYLGALFTAALLGMAIVTGGQPLAYLRYTAAVGSYQYFYFNGMSGAAALPYIFTNGRLLLYTVAPLGYLVYCLILYIRDKLTDRHILLAFLTLCILAATYAYVISGSGYNFTEALEGYTWIAALCLAAKGVAWLLQKRRRAFAIAMAAVVGVSAIGYVGLAVKDARAYSAVERSTDAVATALGTAQAPYPLALGMVAEETRDEEVFSMYATGLEVVKGSFQPTGSDYIIHALGDSNRAQYVAALRDGGWPWVQTTTLPLERWLCVQNWDVYRVILASYEVAFTAEYSRMWQAAGSSRARQAEVEVAATAQPDGSWLLQVTSDEPGSFTADVCISYSTAFNSGWDAFLSLGRKCVRLDCPGLFGEGLDGRVYLAAEAQDAYIPVAIRDGVGYAMLTPCGEGHASLELLSATCGTLLPDVSPLA